MKEKTQIPYYLGIDAGSSSVGWAVTDTMYHVLKTKGKAMWGVRLFPDASTAAERRTHRAARRRLRAENIVLIFRKLICSCIK